MNDPIETVDQCGRENPPVPAESPQPEWIGRYRIERLLGRGGFGVVYLPHDDQLQRKVAIKVPHRKLVDRPEAAEAYSPDADSWSMATNEEIVPVCA